MDATIPNASDRKTTMIAHASRRGAALAAALLAACGAQAPSSSPAAGAGGARGAHASLTGDPACAGPGVHDVHVALFRCDTCQIRARPSALCAGGGWSSQASPTPAPCA